MKTALFLGAGASKAFGYPLTSELLPRILQRLKDGILFNGANTRGQNEEDREWFRTSLFWFFPGLADSVKAQQTPDAVLGVGITDLLTLVDRALLYGESRAGMSPEEIGRFRDLLERAIYEALLRQNQRENPKSLALLRKFMAWLRSLEGSTGIITTNYDRAVDLQLFRQVAGKGKDRQRPVEQRVDFGFPWRRVRGGALVPRPAKPKCQLLKLHGSVNWLKCSLCGQIYLNVTETAGPTAFARRLDKWNTCHCNGWTRLRLHLVTPSFVRQTNDAHLLGIWQAALERLRTADHWVIMGYSLPPEDVAIRSLFLRAWDGHRHKSKLKITVVQTATPWTEKIYRAFFPTENLIYRNDEVKGFVEQPEAPPGQD
ncbi:MAG TPA: hypothetical protein VG734_09985 [Lacunisphaera sp.]|nr:hypothetical protein [Lacunisphaera sp.]